MINITEKVVGNKLTLTIDLSKKGKASKSGKSLVIASTEGNVPVDGNVDIKYGLNVYKPV